MFISKISVLADGIMPEITLGFMAYKGNEFQTHSFDIALKIKNTGTENQEIKNF